MEHVAVSAAPEAAPIPWRAYARLAKLDIWDYYLSVPLVAAMVLASGSGAAVGTTLVVLVLFLAGEVAMSAAMCTFDDVTGYRDGSDAVNYGPDAPARRLARKPLIAGTLTEPQAIRFGWATVAACVLCWLAAVAAAPARPGWALAGVAALAVFGFQYTWWLRISYNGFQEFFLAALGWFFVLPLYGLLTGRFDGFVAVQALVFGLGPLLFGVYSNTNDIPGDRAVGRKTVAVLVSPRANAAFVAGCSALEAVLLVGSAVTGIAPWWFPLVMAPVMALRARQWVLGFVRGEILLARRLGIHLHRLCCALLVGADLAVAMFGSGL
ncbi:UbiA family prenyltransferase [Streptomyces sp. TLI_171]|uniref:UbiA family prenyltransferase n=1 Tax=Streptomyces sp. TLI_171 TaxID=1938859 RepID=UPI000C17F31D|nr:UbiA family prenyltransferase [Streptomyces sp. TLI_171]RKE18154.1 1,4-dihydroxy-2-naphthoate octaprenyltransferase [Streptomyces sp. TLI_171]